MGGTVVARVLLRPWSGCVSRARDSLSVNIYEACKYFTHGVDEVLRIPRVLFGGVDEAFEGLPGN